VSDSYPEQLLNACASEAQGTGWFQAVETFEPKSAPTADFHYCIWMMRADPVKSSGLASSSFRIELAGRIHVNMLREPQGDIDGDISAAAWDLLAGYSGGFTFGGLVREVDLLGSEGDPLALRFGYVSIDKRLFRIADLTIPLICNDVFDQGA
jgi:hypothetical protein